MTTPKLYACERAETCEHSSVLCISVSGLNYATQLYCTHIKQYTAFSVREQDEPQMMICSVAAICKTRCQQHGYAHLHHDDCDETQEFASDCPPCVPVEPEPESLLICDHAHECGHTDKDDKPCTCAVAHVAREDGACGHTAVCDGAGTIKTACLPVEQPPEPWSKITEPWREMKKAQEILAPHLAALTDEIESMRRDLAASRRESAALFRLRDDALQKLERARAEMAEVTGERDDARADCAALQERCDAARLALDEIDSALEIPRYRRRRRVSEIIAAAKVLVVERDELKNQRASYDWHIRKLIAEVQTFINHYDHPELYFAPDADDLERARKVWSAANEFNVSAWQAKE